MPGPKKSASKGKSVPSRKPWPAPSRPLPNALPLKGKKVVAPKAPPPPPVTAAETPVATPATPAPEVHSGEKPLCWIELVKSGSVFIARSNTTGGAAKEYKNRVLEDMLTELIVELQEEIQE